MSATVDQFCDQLRERLDAIERWLQAARADLQALPGHAENALREKVEEARARLQGEKERVEQTRANLKARARQRAAETWEVISEWKAKHETRKLKARADWAEAYAAEAVFNALASIDEAVEAILDAALARLEADTEKPQDAPGQENR